MESFTKEENKKEGEDHHALLREIEHTISTLTKERDWLLEHFYIYKGFWFEKLIIQSIITAQKCFEAKLDIVLLASYPRSGTTWMKALLFTIKNRSRHDICSDTHPFLTYNRHDCVPFIEFYACNHPLAPTPSTALLATHIPYPLIPESIKNSSCPIIYVYREPKDVLISCWHFLNKLRAKELPQLSLEEALDFFSSGVSAFGPYWDHLLGYWKASVEVANKILFIKYEHMKKKPVPHVKRFAESIGHPFSLEEEGAGAIQKTINFGSFDNLSNLVVNKAELIGTSVLEINISNNMVFRNEKVEDYKNYFTEEMKHLDEIIEQKLRGSGFETLASPDD
ncbi:hypothetical protein Nepgr_026129 [Nepenthes gracilis]|uniref:Sulfotransferase n=1 Tax=Nepenthes gracilis TaxID=150966 RepID=A0AAD3Y262_NEPGR|nr:hypothetical protein Nepgr_026129 [Nepenthes gracilis]